MTHNSTDPADRTFTTVGIVAKDGMGSISDEITHISDWLEQRGVEVLFDEAAAELAGADMPSSSRAEAKGGGSSSR